MDLLVKIGDKTLKVSLPTRLVDQQSFVAQINGQEKQARWFRQAKVLVIDEDGGLERRLQIRSTQIRQDEPGGELDVKSEFLATGTNTVSTFIARVDYDVPGQLTRHASSASHAHVLRSQITGKVLKVLCKPGETVKAGDTLLIIEAMKMENRIFAPSAGRIVKLTIKEGEAVATGRELLQLEHAQGIGVILGLIYHFGLLT